jgi:transposase
MIGATMEIEYINEFSWNKIFSFLKTCPGIYCAQESKCKNFMEAIFWMARTGAQWRELHDRYGKWNSIFSRYNAWSKKDIWNQLLQFCVQDPDLEYIMIDATIVRAHACAAGYGIQAEQGLGRSSGGFSTKIHAKVDALGNPLAIILTPGERNDITQADALVADVYGSYVVADKGYDSDAFRDKLLEQDCKPTIPPRSNRINPSTYDEYIYMERHVVECFFSKIKYFRRIFSRFDKSARNYASFIAFVGAILWLR